MNATSTMAGVSKNASINLGKDLNVLVMRASNSPLIKGRKKLTFIVLFDSITELF